MDRQQQIIKAFEDFKSAAINLSAQWEKYDEEGDAFTQNYPFDESFDELVPKIIDWTNQSISSVKS